MDNGQTENPEAETVRAYRVRPDYKTSDFSSETNDGEGTSEEIFEQYKKDALEWPTEKGAPYNDINGDGIYDPSIDIPGFPDAAQSIWFVANDLDSNLTKHLYGSLPMGIELQVTIWGYDNSDFIKNMIFKKYKVINKSSNDINEMYLSIWSDFEIGFSDNDYSACDTMLNLGYMYNNQPDDLFLFTIPPAIGNCLLQGPIIDGKTTDYAYFDGRQVYGKNNLSMTSVHYLYPYKSNQLLYFEPIESKYIEGSLLYYNYMQGRVADGSFHPIPIEFGGGTTRYPLSGNPITSEGFLDGIQQTHSDRSVGIGSGPFELAVGDTQEVVFAEIAALGVDNINSVKILKEYSTEAYNFYIEQIATSKQKRNSLLPEVIELYQNYPNPFNSNTKIKYAIPNDGFVKIKITNLLGEKVRILVDEYKGAGTYVINFDGNNLPSGVYFYCLELNLTQKVRKMLLLK